MPNSSVLEMRRRNAYDILQAVRFEPGLSRAEIARQCELAKSTVSDIVDDLVKSAILKEIGSKTISRGRHPVRLTFNPKARVSIGISIDHDWIEMAICDLNGVAQQITKRIYQSDQDVILQVVFDIEQLLANAGLESFALVGIGIAVPGPVLHVSSTLAAWRNLDLFALKSRLVRQFKCAVVIGTNTNMAALAENQPGAAHASSLSFVIRLGTAVRSAVVANGKIIDGAGGLAGEFGHITVPNCNLLCVCGNTGCVNTIASTEAVMRQANSRTKSKLKNFDELIVQAKRGDEACRYALIAAAEALAYGIAAAVKLFAPSKIVLTGQLTSTGNLLLEPLQENLKALLSPEHFSHCHMAFSELTGSTEAIGAGIASARSAEAIPRLLGNLFTDPD